MIEYLRRLYVTAQLQDQGVLPSESGPSFDQWLVRWLDQYEATFREQIAADIRAQMDKYSPSDTLTDNARRTGMELAAQIAKGNTDE